MLELIAIDERGLQRASLTLKKTWRWNDVRDCREYGYSIIEQDRCDFGSCRFLFTPPVGRTVGVAEAAVWRVAE